MSGPAKKTKKEKGEWRLVVDYRGLNEQTEHDSYSLPLIDSILQKQQKKRKWSGHIGLQPVVVCTDHQSLQSWYKEHVDTPSGPAARRAR